jgi:3-phosphoshikimate 1-carboxyvinyltransferase
MITPASFEVYPSILRGTVIIPSSKSHTLRAIYFAALAQGTSRIEQYLLSPDTMAMIEAVRLLGVQVKIDETSLEICGCGGKPQPPKDVIQCGNSGQVLRFIGALAGLMPHPTLLTGDASIREKRPVKPLLEGLTQLGAMAVSSLDNGYAPLLIKGPLTRTTARIDGEDSQPVSGLLMAGAFAPHPIELHVNNPGEKPWIDLTLHWFKKLGIPFHCSDYTYYRMEGNAVVKNFTYQVPGDFSSAAFPIAAAILTNSELTLQNIDMDDCQGDKAIIPLLEKMGVRFVIDASRHTLTVKAGSKLKGMRIDINDFVDALPILAVIGCFAEGQTEIVNAAIARHKESDRIHSIAKELKKMGANIEEKPDGLVIQGSTLKGAELNTYHDHRMAMALTIAAFAAKTASKIIDVKCIAKTYPSFYEDFKALGANIRGVGC